MLTDEGIKPDVSLGLSLGEYGALYAANCFDYESYVSLTTFRGEKMSEAALGKNCIMSAVLGLDSNLVSSACDLYMKENEEYNNSFLGNSDLANLEKYVTVSNYNCKGQCVICGNNKAVEEMENILKGKGAKRCVRLKVSGPFHTKYMKDAGDELENYFTNFKIENPQIPVLLNATGDYYKDTDNLSELLVKQVQSSVRLEENIEKILDSDIDTFIEIGPGKVVSGFLKNMCDKTAIVTGASRGIGKAIALRLALYDERSIYN